MGAKMRGLALGAVLSAAASGGYVASEVSGEFYDGQHIAEAQIESDCIEGLPDILSVEASELGPNCDGISQVLQERYPASNTEAKSSFVNRRGEIHRELAATTEFPLKGVIVADAEQHLADVEAGREQYKRQRALATAAVMGAVGVLWIGVARSKELRKAGRQGVGRWLLRKFDDFASKHEVSITDDPTETSKV